MQTAESNRCVLCEESGTLHPVLEAKDWEYGVPGAWTLARCGGCGLYQQAPQPTVQEIAAFYPPTYAVYDNKSSLQLLFKFVYAMDAKRIRQLIGPTGRVLDLGCGGGDGLESLSHRGQWDLFGIEFDPGAAEFARKRGFHVETGDVAQTRYEPASFHLIRMGHVIEHVTTPVETLRHVWRLLRPGGILFLETPNIACWDYHVFGRYWGALHFPRHTVLFNEQTLRLTCEKAGFDNIRFYPRMRTVGWSAGIQNFLVDRCGLPIPPRGRYWWYPLLIAPFLPMTFLQSLFSRPATIALTAQRASE